MSMMFATADATMGEERVRQPGLFAVIGAAIRVAGAVDSHCAADRHDLEILGIPAEFHQRLGVKNA